MCPIKCGGSWRELREGTRKSMEGFRVEFWIDIFS